MIYRRFTEKAADEWRQIYKALQLLEFLIKHGSERVIDDARGHITLLKMLRQFHYIDQNGKDQGLNVRNRAKELTELLGDVDRIRAERKKARATKNKYTGVEGGTGRFGGFGNESSGYGGGSSSNFGGFSGGVYGDGGGFGGQSAEYDEPAARADKFEEYDEFDEGERPSGSSRPKRTERAAAKAPAEPPKKKEPEVDLFSFDEPVQSSAPVAAPMQSSGLADLAGGSAAAPANDDDDEFDDFQSAAEPTSNAQFAAPQPVSAPQQANLSNMVGMSSISPAPSSNSNATPGVNYSAFSTPMTATPSAAPAQTQAQPSAGFQSSGPNYFGNVQSKPATSTISSIPTTTQSGPTTMANMRPVASANKPAGPAAGGDAFGALWGKASSGIKKTSAPAGPAMGQLAKEKSSAGIWGTPASSTTPASGGAGSGSASGDLLG